MLNEKTVKKAKASMMYIIIVLTQNEDIFIKSENEADFTWLKLDIKKNLQKVEATFIK